MTTIKLLTVDIEQAGYDKNESIIKDINFSLQEGELLGLIGPNGAGKSTTIKSILGFLPNIKGDIQFIGPKKNYAYVPEQPVFYDKLTLWEHLEFTAAVYNVESRQLSNKGHELLKLFGLNKVMHYYPTTFSKGMQQKLMLIIGFLIKPDIYIIDEPFVGLDPRITKEFINLLEGERTRGAGILISTHQLEIAEDLCQSFIILADGKLVIQGNLAEVRESSKFPLGTLYDCFNKLLENLQ